MLADHDDDDHDRDHDRDSRPAIQPPEGLRIEPHLPPPRPSLLRNWNRAPVDLNPVHSLVLDLTLSDEDLLAQMHPKGRYNLGLSRRHGVQVTRSQSMADVRLYLNSAESKDNAELNEHFHKALLNYLYACDDWDERKGYWRMAADEIRFLDVLNP